MMNRFVTWIASQERWNELGHAFFGFIIGLMGPYMQLAWMGFAVYDEVWRDQHYKFFSEDRNTQLDFLFDIQSKVLPMNISIMFLNHYSGKLLPGVPDIIFNIVCVILIYLIGWKAPWFFSKQEK